MLCHKGKSINTECVCVCVSWICNQEFITGSRKRILLGKIPPERRQLLRRARPWQAHTFRSWTCVFLCRRAKAENRPCSQRAVLLIMLCAHMIGDLIRAPSCSGMFPKASSPDGLWVSAIDYTSHLKMFSQTQRKMSPGPAKSGQDIFQIAFSFQWKASYLPPNWVHGVP